MRRKTKVLVAESDPKDLSRLLQILRQHAFESIVAMDGRQVLARAISARPDLVLMNTKLDKIGGLAVARLLKSDARTSQAGIIFLSSQVTVQAKLAAFRVGAQEYITKPFDPAEVFERIRIHAELLQNRHVAAAQQNLADDNWSRKGSVLQVNEVTDAQRQVLVAATRVIADHAAANLTIAMVASTLHIPQKRLQALFRHAFGITVSEYIKRESMRKAAYMLKETQCSIIDIALTVGYSSASNFSTAFKLFFGITPSKARKGLAASAAIEQTRREQAAGRILVHGTSKPKNED